MQTDHGPGLDQPIIEAAYRVSEQYRRQILDLEMLILQKDNFLASKDKIIDAYREFAKRHSEHGDEFFDLFEHQVLHGREPQF